ncbi:MAG: hypothetical protein V2A61_07150, partial [Calditrichota bacterium]
LWCAIAQGGQLGGQPGSPWRMGLGADRVAMGDCGVALTNNSAPWYYNPAALPHLLQRQVTAGYRWMSLDRSIGNISFAMPAKPNGGVALGVVYAGFGEVDGRDSNGEHFDNIGYYESLIHGSFALKPRAWVSVGLTIKFYMNSVSNIKDNGGDLSSSGLGLDFGTLFQIRPDLSAGLQVRDIGGRSVWDATDVWLDGAGSKDDNFPQTGRFGLAWRSRPDLLLTGETVLNLNDLNEGSEAVRPHLGGEWSRVFPEGYILALRAGYNGDAPSFGLGLTLPMKQVRIRFDYAFRVETTAPGGAHLAGWVFEL